MTVALSTEPVYALPGDAVKVTPTVTGSAANFVRIWLTDAPVGSKLKIRQQQLGGVRINPAGNDPDGNGFDAGRAIPLPLDKGGKYTFVVQEYTKNATTYGGGYAGSPDAFLSETKIGAEQTLYVYIGERVTHRLGNNARGTGTLLLYIWNNSVRQTTIATHGVLSPAIVDCSSPLALSAASDTAVILSLDAMVDNTATNLISGLATLISGFQVTAPKHFNNNPGVYHNTFDTDNDTELEDMPRTADTPEGVLRAAQVIHRRMSLHIGNGSDGAKRYHARPDWYRSLASDPPGDLSSAVATLADAWNVYENHRVDGVVHNVTGAPGGTPDNDNAITASVGPLVNLHLNFFSAMRALSPTANGGTQQGAVTLAGVGSRVGG